MSGLNRSILAGRLTADPDIRYTQNETAVAHFRIAVRGNGNDDQFVDCIAWGGLAKVCGEYLKKGKLVAVEGRLQIRTHKGKTGRNLTKTEVVVENMQMLDSKFYNATKKGGE